MFQNLKPSKKNNKFGRDRDQGIELVREVKGFDFVRTRETELQNAQIYRKF